MIEEPYRWVEAIANRREYIEQQLVGGSPIVALSFGNGILLLTLRRQHQKLFEVYDRIAVGGIGHPGDIERLRMTAIELASTEGFARSVQDVSLRRLVNYSLSSALKAAFEQIYGAPYLARLLFVELGWESNSNLFIRLEYDGSIHSNGGAGGRGREEFGVLSGNPRASNLMEQFLRCRPAADASLKDVLNVALDAWAIGHLTQDLDSSDSAAKVFELPPMEVIGRHREQELAAASIEAAVLERDSLQSITWRPLSDADARALLARS